MTGFRNFPSLSHGFSLGVAIALILSSSACAGGATPTDAAGAYNGTALDDLASNFRLVDQYAVSVALSDFRGQVVVLAFLDAQCREVCPRTAAHLRTANQALRDDARSVVFLAVNVNIEADKTADVETATRKWRLDEIATWHFLTGSAEELEPIWKAYHILVIRASADEELVHTPGVFLIDPTGRQRWYVSTPFDDAGTPQWTAPLSELLVKHIRELLSET